MKLAIPEWLARHGGTLTPASNGSACFVLFGNEPHYKVGEVPVGGKHGCCVIETENGRRIPCDGSYATVDEALQAGLEKLRQTLGW